jgi:hypothetical protein
MLTSIGIIFVSISCICMYAYINPVSGARIHNSTSSILFRFSYSLLVIVDLVVSFLVDDTPSSGY